MNSSEFRKRLTKEVKGPMPSWVWEGLVEEGWVRDMDALDGERFERALSKVVRKAKEAMRAMKSDRTMTKRRRTGVAGPRREPTPAESARVWALSEYIAAEVSEKPSVRDLRRRVLGDRLLSASEAEAFVTSPSARIASLYEFERASALPIENNARIVDERMEKRLYLADVEVVPGTVWKHQYDLGSAIRAPGKLPVGNRMVNLLLGDGATARVLSAIFWSGSVLDDIHSAAKDLARWYPWSEPEAMEFILTGSIPLLPAINPTVQLKRGGPCTITLVIRPWVSPKLVAQVYRDWRNHYFSARPRRPISERNLDVFRFVVQKGVEEGDAATWRGMMGAWNTSNPGRKYPDVRRFRRDFDRAARVIRAERFGLEWTLPDADGDSANEQKGE